MLLLLGLLAIPARAQQVDAFAGMGTARDASNGRSFDTFGDGTLYGTPDMGGGFADFGLSVFFNRQFGAGWTATWRAAHDYAGLQYRPSFHTFDAIFQPVKLRTKRSEPELRAGIGFASVHFDFDDPDSCAQVAGCAVSREFLVHAGVATRLFVTRHVFVRPAADIQFINRFFLFKSNWVPRYSLSVGYSFGRE